MKTKCPVLLKEISKNLKRVANKNGWKFHCYQDNIKMISFKKEGVRINIYLTTLCVSTSMDHPKKGKTQLFRRCQYEHEVFDLFKNPRLHTGRGYYKK